MNTTLVSILEGGVRQSEQAVSMNSSFLPHGLRMRNLHLRESHEARISETNLLVDCAL